MYFRLFARLIIPPILTCFLAALPANAQNAAALWQQGNDAATAAFQNGDYASAELHMKKALKQAEVLGQISEADVNFTQAVNLGADTPTMNQAEMKVILGNYASFLRAQDRVKEAESMETRAAAIPWRRGMVLSLDAG